MLDKYYEKAIFDACDSLRNDGVIIVPTDTLYGLACLSSSKIAIERIYEIKGRDKGKLLPLIVNSYKMLNDVVSVDISKIEKLSKYYPGSLTIVCKRNPNFDYFNVETIAVRMIDSPLINKIISEVNEPLALTSANISNEGNLLDPLELMETFDGVIDCIFMEGKAKDIASTIVRINDDNSLSLIREGKIPFYKIVEEYNND